MCVVFALSSKHRSFVNDCYSCLLSGWCTCRCVEFNGREQINRVVSHPTLPLTITAHEDRHLRFFDNSTGMLPTHMLAALKI